MQNYQATQWSKSYGGARTVFTGTVKGMTSGQFSVDLATLPEMSDGLVPAGTPIKIDESPNARTIEMHYAFEVVAGSTATSVRVKKTKFEGSRAKVSMKLMLAPTDLTVAGTGVNVSAIDRSNSEYDVLTVTSLGAAPSAGDILVEADTTGATAKVKVLPNGLLPYDVVKDPNAFEMWGVDGMFCQVDGEVLTRRIPPIAPAIKQYMRDNDAYFRYSKSQE